MLVCLDSPPAAGLLGELGAEGFEVGWHATWHGLRDERPTDLVIVFGESLVDAVASARRLTGAPLLAVGGTVEEAARALALGADAWLPAGSAAGLVVAQGEALLRRRSQGLAAPSRLGRLQLDSAGRRVILDGRLLPLARRELDLLLVLAAYEGRPLSRDRILAEAWGPRFMGEPKTVDVHVAWLRPKLEGSNVRITTIRGVGYRLDVIEPGPSPDGGAALTAAGSGSAR